MQVTRGVEAALEEMKPGLTGIEIDHSIFRPATFIELSIDNLTMALLIGAVLVIAGDRRLPVRVARGADQPGRHPAVAGGGRARALSARERRINTMVLAGFVIALGSIVDDAIIDVENIVRRLRQHRREGGGQVDRGRIMLEASLEIRSAIVYATLIIVLAVVPVFFMGGLSGAFFEPLAPVLFAGAAGLHGGGADRHAGAVPDSPRQGADRARELPLVALAPARLRQAACRASLRRRAPRSRRPASWWSPASRCGRCSATSLLPSFKERDFLMHWLTPPGTSHPEMNRITVLASKELRAIPGVRNFGAHIGRALVADELVGIDFTENWISVDPKVDYDTTLARHPGNGRRLSRHLSRRADLPAGERSRRS